MGKLVISQFVSLDGVIEDPGGVEGFDRGGWAFKFDRGTEGDKFKLDELIAAGALLLGRTTYEAFAAAWPSMTDEVGFADKINSMPKFVVSSSIVDPGWNNATVIDGDIAAEVSKLKGDIAGDILVHGSGQLMPALSASGLVDEFRLMVFPTVLGPGKRLFEGGSKAALSLVEAKPTGDVLILTYVPAETANEATG